MTKNDFKPELDKICTCGYRYGEHSAVEEKCPNPEFLEMEQRIPRFKNYAFNERTASYFDIKEANELNFDHLPEGSH